MKHILFLLICLQYAFSASSSSSLTHERPLTLTETHELFTLRLKQLDPRSAECQTKLALMAPEIFALARLAREEKYDAMGLPQTKYVNCNEEKDLFWTTPVLFPYNASAPRTLSDVYLNSSPHVLGNLTESLLKKIHFDICLINLFRQQKILPLTYPQDFTSRRFFDIRDQYQSTLITLLKLKREDQIAFFTPKILKFIKDVPDNVKYAKKTLALIAMQPCVISADKSRDRAIAIEIGAQNPSKPTFEESVRITHIQKLNYYMELVHQDKKLTPEALNYLYNRLLQKWRTAKIIACQQNQITIETTPFFRNSIDVQNAHAANIILRETLSKTNPHSLSFKSSTHSLFQKCLTAHEFIKIQRRTLNTNPQIPSITLDTHIVYQDGPAQTLRSFINAHTPDELYTLLHLYEDRKILDYLMNNFYLIAGCNYQFPLEEQTIPFNPATYFIYLDRYERMLHQTKSYLLKYLVQRGLIDSFNKGVFFEKLPIKLAPKAPPSPEKLFLRQLQQRYQEGCLRINLISKEILPFSNITQGIIVAQTGQRIISFSEKETELSQPELCRIKQNLTRKLAILDAVKNMIYDGFHQFWLLDKPIILSKTQPLTLPKTTQTLIRRQKQRQAAASSSTPEPLPLFIKYADKDMALQMLKNVLHNLSLLKQKCHAIIGDEIAAPDFTFEESLSLEDINTITSFHIRRYSLEKWLTDLYAHVQGKFPLLSSVPDDTQKFEEERELYAKSKQILKGILLDHLWKNKLADSNLLDINPIKSTMGKTRSRAKVLNKISAISAISEYISKPASKKSISITIRDIFNAQQKIRENYYAEIDERERLAAAEKRKKAEEAKRIEEAKKAEEAKKRAQELAPNVKAVEVAKKPTPQPKPTTPKPPTKKQLAREKKERREANKAKALQEQKARNKKEAEALAIRKAEEAAARRIAAEEEARRIAAEKEARRIAAEEKAHRIAAEKEARRIAAEEEVQRIAAEKEARRIAAEEEARRIAAEKEAHRIAIIHAHLDKIEECINYMTLHFDDPSLNTDKIRTYYQIRVMKSERQKLLEQLPEEDVETESDSDNDVIFEPSEWHFN